MSSNSANAGAERPASPFYAALTFRGWVAYC
jgi:hypothetical protein